MRGLAENDGFGQQVEVLVGETPAGATEARLRLVDDENRARLPTARR